MKYWDPNTYTLEDQLRDMIGGREVVTCDDGTVLKGTNSHVDIFVPNDSARGHIHAGVDFDDKGRISDYDIYHY